VHRAGAHERTYLNEKVTVLHTASVGTAAGHNAFHKCGAALVFQYHADASHHGHGLPDRTQGSRGAQLAHSRRL